MKAKRKKPRKRPDFVEWFRVAYGPQPHHDKSLGDLRDDMVRHQNRAALARLAFEARQEWDEQFDVARRAWNSAEWSAQEER